MKKLLLTSSLLTVVFAQLLHGQNFQISGGNSFSAAVCNNQTVYTWGSNVDNDGSTLLYTFGVDNTGAAVTTARRAAGVAITYGNISNVAGSTTVGLLPAIRQVDAGSGSHVLGLSCANQVWAWGNNKSGQLGRNLVSTSGEAMPQRVLRGAQAASVNVNDPNGIFLNNITYVSGGNNSSFAIEATTGRLLAWGENSDGQLGDGSTTDRLTPVYVQRSAADGGGAITNIIQVEAGDQCSYALDANGYVWSWGNNTGNKLGRPGASPQTTASRVLRSVPLCNGYGCTADGYLRDITQISGGDTHCLALDINGNVWSFGGDWGEGQLGRGGGSVYQDYASRVVNPGVTAYGTVEANFLGSGVDGKAVYVSAGQASSAVVMSNGKVVTFGGRGLFNSGATSTNAGNITCPSPAGDMIASGTLGDNNTTGCNSTSCSDKATQWSRTPVYVKVGGVDLTNIAAVSDGDGWYFAIAKNGSAYAWGWNRRGELGVGDYNDRCQAVSYTLPTGCGSFDDPCPKQPRLGADMSKCPVFTQTLDALVAQEYTTWRYTWEFRPLGSTGAWTVLSGPITNAQTYSANQLGQYRISMSDTRPSVPALCGPCPVLRDTIIISEIPNPYTVTACADNSGSTAKFDVTAPAASTIKWYTNLSGGTALNPSNTNPSITVPFSQTNTTIPGCARALFAEDVSSLSGALMPTIPCAVGSTAGNTNSEAFTFVQFNQSASITSISFVQGTGWGAGTYEVRIYSNGATASPWCNDCSPNGNYNGPTGAGTLMTPAFNFADPGAATARTYTFPTAYNVATPGSYWIGIKPTAGAIRPFTGCVTPGLTASSNLWSTPVTEPNNVLVGRGAFIGNSANHRGGLYNITYQAGASYPCGRILVCVSSSCTLPVTYINISATNKGNYNQIDWATSSEKNAAYFVVERSTDGVHFATAGRVDAIGNSNVVNSYSFKDLNNPISSGYYRILQVDEDGSGLYSEMIYINNSGLGNWVVIPNPSNGKFSLKGDFASMTSEFELFSTTGQIVRKGWLSSSTEEFDLTDLPKGVYIMVIKSNIESQSIRIVLD
ncbi:MAG: T9SS type A sorting domain-containing protein [Cytophagaceae bacterium]